MSSAILSALLASTLTACANTADTDPVRVEQDFGRSVDQMIEAQIYDPKAARKPPTEPPMGLDGVQGEAILKTHREHVGDPKKIDEDVQLDITPGQ
jgi:hypothetical protein